MARPGSRIDLVFLPADPDATGPDPFEAPPGEWHVERHPRAVLYTRQQGGFVARCPVDDAVVTAEFVRAHAAWRDGRGPRAMVCGACGDPHDLAALRFTAPGASSDRPAAAYARFSVIQRDAPTATPSAVVTESLSASIGAYRLIARRPAG